MIKKLWSVILVLLTTPAWVGINYSQQTQLGTTTAGAAEMSYKSEYDITGTVIRVDQEDMISIQTNKGLLKVHLPGTSKDIKEGDKITIHLGCKEGEVNKFKAFPYLVRPTVDDYLRCVKGCKDVLLGRGVSLDKCIEGCRATSSP